MGGEGRANGSCVTPGRWAGPAKSEERVGRAWRSGCAGSVPCPAPSLLAPRLGGGPKSALLESWFRGPLQCPSLHLRKYPFKIEEK